ncbi:RCC1 domain-containing protein [Solilutibacter tolerans]|uniref:Alpha-tubulin suppressor n=1 Tax=Solilutibacter tolerans TaxID=1604334 RepID=A0A1N6UP71_9GAMM|nr:hypothetical protein [Lysobacter tolerans]SIQ67414.1 Alpha-tubulin suppressor [Lysobacter tolerans]
MSFNPARKLLLPAVLRGLALGAILTLPVTAPALAQSPRIVQLAGSMETTFALREDGSVVGWGRNDKGQLGPDPTPGNVPHKARPTPIALPGRARQIASGGDNGYALLEDGRLFAWGKGEGLGTGGSAGGVVRQAVADRGAGLRRAAGQVQSMADEAQRASRGDLGAAASLLGGLLSRKERAATPKAALSANLPPPAADSAVPIEVPLRDVKQIYAYKGVAIALMQDGTLRAWGSRSAGRVGDGKAVKRWGESSPPALSPVVVTGAEGITQVSIGDKHVLALRNDGRVLSWGLNARGQLGRQPVQEQALDTPDLVEGVSDAVQVAAGDYPVSMAVRHDGSLLVWGSSSMAHFGSGEADNGRGEWDIHPRPVPGVRSAARVVVGNLNAIAILRDGSLMGWGNTDWGNLGIGKKTGFVYSPTRLALRDVVDVVVQFGRTYAIKRDGSLWYMGVGDKEDWQSPHTSNASPIPLSLQP